MDTNELAQAIVAAPDTYEEYVPHEVIVLIGIKEYRVANAWLRGDNKLILQVKEGDHE